MEIQELIQQVREKHVANPPSAEAQIAHLESSSGFKLPEDLKSFYRACNGAELFAEGGNAPYTLLPIEQVKRTRELIFGEDDDTWAPASWYGICDVMDGNFIGIDLNSRDGRTFSVIDCFHETHGSPGGNTIIALSFTEFLRDALASRGRQYWLDEHFHRYGDALATHQGE